MHLKVKISKNEYFIVPQQFDLSLILCITADGNSILLMDQIKNLGVLLEFCSGKMSVSDTPDSILNPKQCLVHRKHFINIFEMDT